MKRPERRRIAGLVRSAVRQEIQRYFKDILVSLVRLRIDALSNGHTLDKIEKLIRLYNGDPGVVDEIRSLTAPPDDPIRPEDIDVDKLMEEIGWYLNAGNNDD